MKELFDLADLKYRDFQAKLLPDISIDRIIGVRVPLLRRFAKEFEGVQDFMDSLPHKYYDENNLHAFLIERIKDIDICMAELERFLPYVDNWATCDMMKPKVLHTDLDKLYKHIKLWISSSHTYTVRYGIVALMTYFLGNNFNTEHADLVASIKSEEYYIRMAQAWYFATALATNRNEVLPYFEKKLLPPWTHNKSIQKARESYRISKEDKEYLKCLKFSSEN